MLKVGRIEYANCTPLFHILMEQFDCKEFEFIEGVPASLNRMLLSGEIDVCPSSSIEYANYPERYKIIPDLSISSIGAVASVLLFSKVPINELDGKKILLSSESATSVNLLKIILAEKYGCSCSFEVAPPSTFAVINESSALLLIGDSALRYSHSNLASYKYDLGEIWYSWTGLPFVFALWLCRNNVADSRELKNLASYLLQSKKMVPSQLHQIVEQTGIAGWMGKKELIEYWRDNISYQFDSSAQAGLLLYYEKCFKNRLLKKVPELEFIVL